MTHSTGDTTSSDSSAAAQPSRTPRLLAALGPGLLMASAAVGGSHLISSTKAGALFEWQLVGLVILVNVLKYPFFKFGPQYTAETGRTLIEGYAAKGKAYLWVFFVLVVVSSVIATAGVGLLAAVILKTALGSAVGVGVPVVAVVMMLSVWLLLVLGRYGALDAVTKVIMIVLTLATVFTVIVAAAKGSQAVDGAVAPSPWTWASLPFLIALMGWMPAPIEISAVNSLWVKAKGETHTMDRRGVLFDFNVGYIGTTILALFFVALGALVQFGTGEKLATSGGKYVPQLINMYGATVGQWAVPIITLIAFFCMYGTTITVVDGYARASAESVRLLRGQDRMSKTALTAWVSGIGLVGLAIIVWMSSSLAAMLNFAMIAAFVMAPVFAALNFFLVRGEGRVTPVMQALSWAGLVFLTGFAGLFIAAQMGVVG